MDEKLEQFHQTYDVEYGVKEAEPPLIDVKPNVDPKTIPDSNRLVAFFDRIQCLEEEKKSICSDIQDIYRKAKGEGFDPKVMRQVLKLRKMDPADRHESEFLRDEYKKMSGIGD